MVNLGPLGPWSGPPDMAIPALERWHAAWERDHPELLGPGGASFYRPEPAAQVSEAHPLMVGICASEVRRILDAMGVTSATEAEIDHFLTQGAREEAREAAAELAAYRTVAGAPDAVPPACECGMKILGCPACYAPYCPSCEQRHVFDCGRRWEQQDRERRDGPRFRPGGIVSAPLPPLHVDPLLIGDIYGRKPKAR